jgi:hypothetical protein
MKHQHNGAILTFPSILRNFIVNTAQSKNGGAAFKFKGRHQHMTHIAGNGPSTTGRVVPNQPYDDAWQKNPNISRNITIRFTINQ